MKSVSACIFLFFILAYSSYTQTAAYGDPVQEPADILKNEKSFLKYLSALNFSQDFIALNTSAEEIDKGRQKEFLYCLALHDEQGELPGNLIMHKLCFRLLFEQ